MQRLATPLLIAFCLTLTAVSPTYAGDAGDSRTIHVSGDAEIRVTPNQVILSLGVSADDMVLAEAKRKSDEKSAALLEALDQQGIARKDIQSDYIRIEPRYDRDHGKRVLLGYFVDKTYVVTVRDIDAFEAVLSAALQSGAEYVHGIQFVTTDLRKHRDAAREKALVAAHQKAADMAAALDMTIGRALSVQESGSRWYSPYNAWGRTQVNYSQNFVEMPPGSGGEGVGTLEPGKISVTSTVSVTFELK